MRYPKTMLFSFVIPAILIFLDQCTKRLAVLHLKDQTAFVILPRILELSYLENTGAAFGSFAGRQTFLIALTALVILAIVWKYAAIPRENRYLPLRLSVLSVLSGACGNLIDRAAKGYVVDFIYFVPIDFPKFNVADICITVGVAALALLMFFYYTEEELDLLWKSSAKS